MRRAQYRRLTADHRTPTVARYVRGGVRRRWVDRLPVPVYYALYVLAAVTGASLGWMIGQTIQAALVS